MKEFLYSGRTFRRMTRSALLLGLIAIASCGREPTSPALPPAQGIEEPAKPTHGPHENYYFILPDDALEFMGLSGSPNKEDFMAALYRISHTDLVHLFQNSIIPSFSQAPGKGTWIDPATGEYMFVEFTPDYAFHSLEIPDAYKMEYANWNGVVRKEVIIRNNKTIMFYLPDNPNDPQFSVEAYFPEMIDLIFQHMEYSGVAVQSQTMIFSFVPSIAGAQQISRDFVKEYSDLDGPRDGLVYLEPNNQTHEITYQITYIDVNGAAVQHEHGLPFEDGVRIRLGNEAGNAYGVIGYRSAVGRLPSEINAAMETSSTVSGALVGVNPKLAETAFGIDPRLPALLQLAHARATESFLPVMP